MPREEYYQKLLLIGAIWNWLATGSFAVGYKILFPLFGMKLPLYPVFFLMFLGICFVFGIGYFWVSRDIDKNHDIVKLGIIGKLMVFAALLWPSVTGEVSVILAGAGGVDLIFAILFIKFLTGYSCTGYSSDPLISR